VSADDVSPEVRRLAEALLLDVDAIAHRSVARMQELLPSYARVPPEDLLPVTTTNVRNVLEAIRNPDRDVGRERMAYRTSGETRARQGITSDEMLNAWRIGLESVRESAHPVAADLRISTDVLLEFIEATLRWGDIGMRASASAATRPRFASSAGSSRSRRPSAARRRLSRAVSVSRTSSAPCPTRSCA